jgi:Pyruvate/2-oxoacid:ferredoxin oxidoreductase gamma subunit
VEREVMLTGIGGQGVQLAAQVLARAAVLEGRHVALFGLYGGQMRGGSSDSSVVVADAPVQAPPLLSRTWSAILLHHKYWEGLAPKIDAGGVVVVNSSLFEATLDRDRYRVFEVPATDLAASVAGSALAASMVMVGAFVAITALVGLDAALAGMREALPAYRRQHADANATALRAGFEAAGAVAGEAAAWREAAA